MKAMKVRYPFPSAGQPSEHEVLLCSELGIRARVALYFPNLKARVLMEDLEGIPLLTFTTTPGAPFPLFVKSLVDRLVSLAGLVLLSPLLVAIAAAVWIRSVRRCSSFDGSPTSAAW